jgi:hypothetical protein
MKEHAVESSPARCPLCGGDNDCAMTIGAETCWCFAERIPADVLRRIPPSARNRVCVCKTCSVNVGSKS